VGGKGKRDVYENYMEEEKKVAIGRSYCTDCTLHGVEMRYGGAPGRCSFKSLFFKLFFGL
jgi:hypothetical protein